MLVPQRAVPLHLKCEIAVQMRIEIVSQCNENFLKEIIDSYWVKVKLNGDLI